MISETNQKWHTMVSGKKAVFNGLSRRNELPNALLGIIVRQLLLQLVVLCSIPCHITDVQQQVKRCY